MDPSGCIEEVEKAHEAALLDVGNKLANPPSSIDELLSLLARAEYLLSQVQQICTCHKILRSVQDAIHPAMQALVSEKIFKHSNRDVQVAVASCINEIVRITIWDCLYTDAQMKEIFQLFIVAFKQLSCESGKNYERALRILDTMAEIRSCLVMLDLNVEMDTVVVDMFQIFLDIIRPHHSSDIFNLMKKIMILIVQEDEFSVELPRTLLSSVRMDSKNTSPRSWELGRSVIESCATILQQHFREAMKAKNLNVADYAELVSSLCQDTPIANDKMPNEEVARIQVANGEIEEVTNVQLENGDVKSDGLFCHTSCQMPNEEVASVQVANGEIEEVTNVQMDNGDVKSDASGDGVSKLEERYQAGPETQTQAERRRREIRFNTLMRPEEGYQHAWLGGGSTSSQEETNSVKKFSVGKRAQSKNKDRTLNQVNRKEISDKQKKIPKGITEKEQKVKYSAMDSEGKDKNEISSQKHELGDVSNMPEKAELCSAKAKGCNMQKKTAKRVSLGSITTGTKKEQVNRSTSAPELKAGNEITAPKPELGDLVEMVVKSSVSVSTKAKQPRVDGKGSNKGKKTKGFVQCRTVGVENARVYKGNKKEITSEKHETEDVPDKPAKAKESKVDEGSNKRNKKVRGDVRSRKVGREKEKVNHYALDSLAKDENEITSLTHESVDIVVKVVERLPKQPKVEHKLFKKRKRTTKSCVLLSSKVSSEKEKVSHSVADPRGKGENEITSEKHESGNVMDKVVEFSTSKLVKAKESEIKESDSNKQEKTTKSVVRPNTIGTEMKKFSHTVVDSVAKDENEVIPQKHESADVVEKMLKSVTSEHTKAKRSKAKEKGSNKLKKATKNVIRSSTLDVKKENNHIDADPEREDENGICSQTLEKYESDVVDKVLESPLSTKAEYPGDLDSEKDTEPKDFRLEYGWELVNLRIMIWWPLDKSYYTGTVESYDPVIKKHKIKYDDDEEEMLDMSVERWELFTEVQSRLAQSSHKREVDPSPAKVPAKTQKKEMKRKAGPSTREPAGPSSKRSKSEGVLSGNSEFEHIPVDDESDDNETSKAKFSWKARAMSRAGKQRSNTSRRKGKPSCGTPNVGKN